MLNIPDGATHYDDDGNYFKIDGWFTYQYINNYWHIVSLNTTPTEEQKPL